jgi:hypothetical protein
MSSSVTETIENSSNDDDELHPKKSCTHRLFRFVKFLAIVAALAMTIGQLLGIAFHFVGPIQYVLRVYMIGFCIVMILNEMEWISFIYQSSLLSNWISRGVLYSFVGTIGISQYTTEAPSTSDAAADGGGGFPQAALLYIQVVAWGMVGIGIIYFFLGIFCCQLVYQNVRKDYEQRFEWGKRKQREQGKKRKSQGGSSQNQNKRGSTPIVSSNPMISHSEDEIAV